MKIAKNIHCPSEGIDCPYYARGWCQMEEETGDHPSGQCDEYDFYNGDEEEEGEE